jgi:hypothetical protein
LLRSWRDAMPPVSGQCRCDANPMTSAILQPLGNSWLLKKAVSR